MSTSTRTHTRTRTRAAALAVGLAAPFLLTACGGDDGEVAASADHNAADVEFATDMIPHHAQALVMVDMADGRDLTPETADLMERIEAAQAPEIEQMTGWLEEWDEPVPNSDGMGMMDGMDGMDMGDMSGMMSQQDFDDLEAAQGSAFERMWLSMMIAHHEGAVEMSEVQLEEGEYADALALAESIIESQQAEIEEMEELLER